MSMSENVTLADLHAANIARQAEWCPDQVPDLSFRGNELAGEAGEAAEALILHAAELGKVAGGASNVVKKLERERYGWRGSRASLDDLAQELADVVICADLCAVTAGIDLGAAVVAKFNATSEKVGLATKLASAPTPPDRFGEEVGRELKAGGDLGELARLSEAATPGAWYTVDPPWGNSAWLVAGNPDPHAGTMVCDCQDVNETRPEDGPDAADDAAFIAACVNYVRKILARSRTLQVAGNVRAVQIREGAYYASAAGERVGPMHRIQGDAAQVWYARGRKGDWLPDGRALHSSEQDNLVAEWTATEEDAR